MDFTVGSLFKSELFAVLYQESQLCKYTFVSLLFPHCFDYLNYLFTYITFVGIVHDMNS